MEGRGNTGQIDVIGYGKKEPLSKDAVKLELKGDVENPPLYVVDGVENKDINWLAPDDIEKITVLKDASATALYGDKGENGVLIIETKTIKKLDVSDKIVIVDGKKYKGDINDIPAQDIASVQIQKRETDVVLEDGEEPQKDKIVINTKTKYNTGGPLIVIDGVKSDKTPYCTSSCSCFI